MTKQEALEYLTNTNNFSYDGRPFNWNDYDAAVEIAIECIQECIDREESPCYNCYKDTCRGCLYNGRLD